jgi:hypothetical protein
MGRDYGEPIDRACGCAQQPYSTGLQQYFTITQSGTYFSARQCKTTHCPFRANFLARNHVNILPWPAVVSPDMSPIVHIWDDHWRRLRTNHQIDNVIELARAQQVELHIHVYGIWYTYLRIYHIKCLWSGPYYIIILHKTLIKITVLCTIYILIKINANV